VLALHGHGSDRWQFVRDTRGECQGARDIAAKYEMIYVSPDYRASTSWMGPAAEADVVQLIDDLKAKYKIDKVFVIGGSMGGTAALTFAALHPELVAGACAQNPHANLLEYTNFQDAIAASFGGTKDKIPAEYKKRSAEYWPENFTMPVAITTGGNDAAVPPQSAMRLAGILKTMGRKVLLIHRPNGGHTTDYADTCTAFEFVVCTALGLPIPQAPATPVAAGTRLFADQKPAVISNVQRAELGLKFEITADGTLAAFYFYKAEGETGDSHTLRLWNAKGEKVQEAATANETASGWQKAALDKPFAVKKGETYTVSYANNQHYPATANVFAQPVEIVGVKGLTRVYSFANLGEAIPTGTYQAMSYFLDVEVAVAK